MSDHAAAFLYADPPLGGFPDSNLMIGTAFEAGGAYENWGFVVYRKTDYHEGRWKLEQIAAGRSIQQATERARERLRRESYESNSEKCWRCGTNPGAAFQRVAGESRPICLDCMVAA